MAPPSICDLPPEVLRRIPAQAEDLLSLVLVNRHLNFAYTPQIYETVDFIRRLPRHRQQLTSLIRTVAASPQLAAHVRKLYLQGWNNFTFPNRGEVVFETKATTTWIGTNSYHKRDRHYVRLDDSDIGPFLLSNLPNLVDLRANYEHTSESLIGGAMVPQLQHVHLDVTHLYHLRPAEIAYYLKIPHLESLTVSKTFKTPDMTASLNGILPRSSSLKLLDIDLDFVRSQDLATILRIPRSLEKLRLHRPSERSCLDHDPPIPTYPIFPHITAPARSRSLAKVRLLITTLLVCLSSRILEIFERLSTTSKSP
jgi:hypothetical protein